MMMKNSTNKKIFRKTYRELRPVIAASFLIISVFSQLTAAPEKTENTLFAEISSAYESGFYPGVVKYAGSFKKQFSHSALTPKVMLYEGESLFRISRLDEASVVLKKVLDYDDSDKLLKLKANYWLGRTSYEQKDYSSAARFFYDSAEKSKAFETEKDVYNSSIYYGAKSFAELKNYSEAEKLLEYVVANGNNFTHSEYEDSVLLLFASYESSKDFKKTQALYKKLPQDFFSAQAKHKIMFYYADALNSLGNYTEAYGIYENLIENAEAPLAFQSLQRAYLISVKYREELKKEPSKVLVSAKEKFSGYSDFNYTDFIDDFYLRLGIDFYNSGNYQDSSACLKEISKEASSYIAGVKDLYQAQLIVADGFGPVQTRASEAENFLLSKLNSVKDKDIKDSYCKQLARFAGLQKKWQDCIGYVSKVTVPDSACLYWKAFAEQNSDKFEQAQKTLETSVNGSPVWENSSESECLYAVVLAQNGKNREACRIFSSLEKQEKLNEKMRLNYIRALIECSDNDEALKIAGRVTSPVAVYYKALANFNLKNWKESKELFRNYLDSSDSASSANSDNANQRAFALFYLGFAQFRLSEFNEAFENLFDFAGSNPKSSLAWYAYFTSASAAVYAGDFFKAQKASEAGLSAADTVQKKQESVMQCASVYSDSGEGEKAEKLLQPYFKQNNHFGNQCGFALAQVYERQEKIKEADSVYATLSSRKNDATLAEEALYRRGELYYSVNDYKTSSQRFSDYLSRYSSGKFSDGAMYYKAECLRQMNQGDKAALQYELLLNSIPKTTYRYPAMKNLCILYRDSGNYEDSLSYAQKMLSEFPAQAKEEKIDIQEKELLKLVKGTDSRIVAKLSEYEKNGGLKTESGRIAGTELAALYAEKEETFEQAAALAKQILPLQKKNLNAECGFAAENAFLLAKHERTNQKNKESADLYLEAAEYFRMSGKSPEAASSLYGAIEAFDASGNYGDAKETADLLEKLYPESRQNIAAKRIINRME